MGRMDIRDLKEEIINRELLPDILAEIGCHHIQDKGDYIQYRLALGAKNSLRTPRVTGVTVNFE